MQVSMSEPKNDLNPPFSDLAGTIKEARRHRSVFQKAPLRSERLQQLYDLADELRSLMASNPVGEKPLPDGRSPMSKGDLLATILAGRDFDLLRPRLDEDTGSEVEDAEREANVRRHKETIKAQYDLWTSPKRLKELGFDASTIDMLNTENDAEQRAEMLHDLIEREIDLLEPPQWKLPKGLQHEDGLMWANVLDLNDKISAAYRKLPNLSTVRKDLAPNTKRLEGEQRIIDRRDGRIERANVAVKSLYKSLLKEVASINEQAFTYYGAKAEFDKLRGPAQSQEGVIVLTACIIAARKVGKGTTVYEQDLEIFREVRRAIRKGVSAGKF